jgi:GNAT superfamily N-acetyltransferase
MDEQLKLDSVRAERAALASVHAVATPQQKQSLGLFTESLSGCLVSICAAEQGIMLNRTVGLGVFRPAEGELPDRVMDAYRQRGIGRAFIALSEGSRPADLAGKLLERGLSEARAWAKFVRPPDPPDARPTGLRVALVERGQAGDWSRIVARAFGMPESAAPLLAGLAGHPAWHLFMSFAGDRPAGAAGLFVHRGVAWFDWAATDPEFRRRGSHGALMSARIDRAIELGCTHLMTATGEAVPGDPQHSWGNITRYGFTRLFGTRNFELTTACQP